MPDKPHRTRSRSPSASVRDETGSVRPNENRVGARKAEPGRIPSARHSPNAGSPAAFQEKLLTRQLTRALRAAAIPAAQIREVLAAFRAQRLPETGSSDQSLTRQAVLDSVVRTVRVGEHDHVLDARAHTPKSLERIESARQRRLRAEQLFDEAFALEESDPLAARAGYLSALDAHAHHEEARINLGRLLHLNGELELAEKVYRRSKHSSALLQFNLGILMEDMNRPSEAISAYRAALALDPSLHDAHFNLSLLHEREGRERDAFRHLLSYRRLTRGSK